MVIPTMNKMMKVYVDSASVERLKCGRPGEGTVQNTVSGYKAFRRWLNERRDHLGYAYIGFDEDFPSVSIIKPDLIHKYLADMLKRGVKPVTAMSYLNQLQSLFAKWVRPYYEDRGWKVPQFPSLGKRPRSQRYQRPSAEQLAKVKKWYEDLNEKPQGTATQSLWFAATMMLEFGMRNSDVLRLKTENFVEKDGMVYLNYTPHKTENSSGRMVKWPIHPTIWEKIRGGEKCGVQSAECGEKCDVPSAEWSLPDFTEDIFRELNRQMRGLGFTGTKGAYELRKICVDHVYQKYGAEMATSISGDDIKTIIRYYADPSQPNIGAVRVVDLL